MTSKTDKTRKFRPSPAMIVSCVALCLALAGTAVAAPQLIRSANIANGTIRTVDLSKDSVKSPKIADGTVSAADLGPDSVGSEEIAKDAVAQDEIADNAVASAEVAPDSLTADDLAANSVGSSEVADQSLTQADLGINSVGETEVAADAISADELAAVNVRTAGQAIANGANGSVSVSCAPGEQVLSGGGQPGNFGVEMTSSRPSGNGWLYQAKNNSGGASNITVFAVCLAP